MKYISGFMIALMLLGIPNLALAYVGPGAGLSLLGALWALVIAVATALAFIFLWPLRRLLRRRREARERDEVTHPHGETGPQPHAQTSVDEERSLHTPPGS